MNRIKNVSHKTILARHSVLVGQCRYMPRTGPNREDAMNRNTSLSPVHWDEEPVNVSETGHSRHYTEPETITESNRDCTNNIEDDPTKSIQSKDEEINLMKARLRSKYQLYNESLPSDSSDSLPTLGKTDAELDAGNEDFFGIYDQEIAKHGTNEILDATRHDRPTETLSKEDIYERHWQPLAGEEVYSKEKVIQASYGWIRMDEDNALKEQKETNWSILGGTVNKVPRSKDPGDMMQSAARNINQEQVKHSSVGLYNDLSPASYQRQEVDTCESDNLSPSDENLSGTEFIDQQYFSYDDAYKTMKNSENFSPVAKSGESYIESQYFPETTEQGSSLLNDIGEQYFSNPVVSQYETETLAVTDHQRTHSNRGDNSPVEGKTGSPEKMSTVKTNKVDLKSNPWEKNEYEIYDEQKINDSFSSSEIGANVASKVDVEQTLSAKHSSDRAHGIHDEVIVEQIRKPILKLKPNLEKPETAYDLAMKIRQENKGRLQSAEDRKMAHESLKNWKGKLDSKGFRILKDQVVNLEYLPRDAVVDMLKNSIIFQNDDLIVIDKPYGLPSHGGPGVHHSVGGLLPLLAERFHGQKQPLHLIHRLDKETTGVMLLGRNAEVAWKIHGMFKRREVNKTYWALTKGVPNPRSGLVDIPMAEDQVKGRYRMGLRPYRDENTKLLQGKAKQVNKLEAVTEYKVLSFISTAALVECTPKTGVKHQIRCHLSFGLNTPIIGDHKYSHFSFIKPQKLHPETLNRLKIRQPTVRYLPMHLHARELVLPEFYEGKNTIFRSKLPEYFIRNMRWLKLAIPK